MRHGLNVSLCADLVLWIAFVHLLWLQNDGFVEPIIDPVDGPVGPHRVWVQKQKIPGLAMSRSLGDKLASTVGVCADPVVNYFKVCRALHSARYSVQIDDRRAEHTDMLDTS
eukprot:SAG31_NODE_20831_length_564_cov_1.335484_2_plen_112_part_00